MATQSFKKGDTVRLKSGGPLMTVTQARIDQGEQKIWTSWFDEHHKESTGFFPAEAVVADDGIPSVG